MSAGPTSKQSLRIAALYAVAGAAWILFSDRAAAALFPHPATLAYVNTAKGWLFVAGTAGLLHVLVRRQLAAAATSAADRTRAEAARTHAETQQSLAREAAAAAARRLAVATQAAQLGTWEWEIATGRVLCDAQMHTLYHVAPGERPGAFEPWMDLVHPGDQQRLRGLLTAALDGRRDYHTQFRILWPGGEVRHLEAHAVVLRDPADQPQRMIGVNWDITERVLTEQRYRLLADHVGDVLWVLDLGTRRFTYVSPSIERLRGYTVAEVLEQRLEDCLTPGSLALAEEVIPRRLEAFLSGDPAALTQYHEVEQYRRDGSTIWTEIVTTFVRTDQGGVEILGVTRDISQRRAAEQALKASTIRLRHAEEVAGIGHWTLRLDTHTIEGSEGAARLYGLPPGREWTLPEIRALALPEFHAALDEALRALVAAERPYDINYQIRPLGTDSVRSIHSRAEYGPATRTVFGIIQDITEREQALGALRASEAKMRLLVSHAPVVLFQIGADGLFRMSEGAGLAKLGLRPGQVVGQSAYETYREIPAICAQIRTALAGQVVHDLARVGDTWFEIVYNPIVGADRVVTDIIGLAIDITERKQAEARLRLESAALSAAALGIAITDARGLIEWVNPAFTTLTGYTAAEALGQDLGQLVQSGQHTEEFYRQLWATILAGDTWHGELLNRHKDGTLVPEEQTITPVRDEDGRIAHFIAIKQNIAERRRLQEQALRSQRLDSIGRLAGGIAHDLNNILAPVLMAPSVLRETVTDPEAREVLDAVEISANRGAAIIRQLLTFSRGGSGAEHRPVQLLHVVRDMVAIIRETFPKNIVTRTDLHSEPWLVAADATQLHQVLMNLCVNSRDAMPVGGSLTIALENVELDEAAVAGHPGAAPGPHVLLGVFDTGQGIAPEHLDKVFDPFFTTKEVGKGTGLGLATTLGIVLAHHGFVDVRSQPGVGTQVRVYLPASPAAISPATTPEEPLPPRGTGQLVLVVDDEENVRRITRRILEHHGYRVLAASDGAEALARFQQHRASIQLVLTDLLMPFMDGATLIHAIHRLDPAARIVAVSGHTATENPLRVGPDVFALLPKPYLRPALLQTVAAALAAP